MTETPEQFLIRNKGDFENADRLIAMGWPAVAPVLPHLMEWLQDFNWPVARQVAPFLVSIGEPICPEIWKVFKTDDIVWKYWCISELVGRLPMQLAAQFRPELERLAMNPTFVERHEELDEVARDVLVQLDSDQQSLTSPD